MENNNFNIANLNEEEYQALKAAEALLCSKLGKDVVLIAWEPK